MAEAQPQQIPTILWLLNSDGFALLALGLSLTVVSIVLVIRPNRMASTKLVFLSLLPGVFGLIAVYSAAAEYSEMAASPRPPQPVEFAKITGRAMSYSFCGLLGTIVPVSIAVLGLSRACKQS